MPTDFGLGSSRAMACAVSLAKTTKSKLVAVHAIDPFEYSFGPKNLCHLKQQQVWLPVTKPWLNG